MAKIDAELFRRLSEYKTKLAESPAERSAAHPVRVLLKYSGPLDVIESHGFRLQTDLGEVAVGFVDLADLERVAALDSVVHIEAERYRSLHLKDSVPQIDANQVWAGNPSITGAGVIVGVVDTGIDIFHGAFCNPDGSTRILFIWDQFLTPQGSEHSPPGFSGGVEFAAADINAALKTPNTPFRHADVVKHGTHVAGTSAGNGSLAGNCHGGNTYVGVAPQASFIIVKALPDPYQYAIIPTASPYTVTVPAWLADKWVAYFADGTGMTLVTANPGAGQYTAAAGTYTFAAADAGKAVIISFTSNPSASGASNADYLAAVKYVFTRAQTASATGGPLPAVVNLSLGGEVGSHDGTSLEESQLDGYLTGTTGKAIIVAAGNDGGKDTSTTHSHPNYGLHAGGTIAANGSRTLTLVIQPNDFMTDLLDLWYAGPGSLNFTINSPSGASLAAVIPPAGTPSKTTNGTLGTDSVSLTYSVNNSLNQKNEIWVQISPPPPVAPVPPATAAVQVGITAGSWTITLTETAGTAVDFDCWIALERRDRTPYFALADQDSTHTVTVPGTATNVITVGAYDTHTATGSTLATLAPFSSHGPTTATASLPARQKPDICAPGVGIYAPASRRDTGPCCCDCCADSYIAMEGTSMASPHVTGVVALMMQKNPVFSFNVIRSALQGSGRAPDPVTGPTLPNNDWGYGMVDALAAVKAVPGPPVGTPLVTPATTAASPPAGASAMAPVGAARATIPLAAMWSTYLPPRQRLQALAGGLRGNPIGQLLAALVSTHFAEVSGLIRRERRVAARWQAMHGPQILREVVRPIEDRSAPLLPAQILGDSLAEGLDRMLAMLARWGGAALRSDIGTYRALVLSVPGLTADQLRLLPPDVSSRDMRALHRQG